MDKGELHLRVDQHDMVELGQQIAQFGLVGFEKLAANGDIIEKVFDLDIGADRALIRLLQDHRRAVYLEAGADLIVGTAGKHLDLRHGTDTG